MNADRNNGSGRFTLPRKRILRGKTHFDRLFKEGNRLSASTVDLRYLVIPDATTGCLVAFVAGRRLGNAVVRNRIKRHLREAYRHYPVNLGAECGLHAIFIAKRSDALHSVVESDIRSLIDRLHAALPT